MSWTGTDFLSYSWGSEQFGRQSEKDQYSLSFQPARRRPEDFKSECYRVARRIYESTDQQIVVLMSGGADSEIVARSFFDQKIPFKVQIFQFHGADNYDIHFAVNFCKARDIDFVVTPFDQEAFAQSEFWPITNELKAHKAFVAFDIARWQRTPGYAVFGNGDVHLEAISDQIVSLEDGAYALPWVWQRQTGAEGCYRFFKATPEIQLAYIEHPFLNKWRELAPIMRLEDTRWWKHWIFKDSWHDLMSRPKRTGYEVINKIYSSLDRQCRSKYSYKKMEQHSLESELYQQLKGEHGTSVAEL